MTPKIARPGEGHFQWNAGGHFGSQLGGTLWLLSLAWFAPLAPEVTALGVGLFVAANAVGFALWSRRDRIAPYLGMQLLLLTCGLAGLVAFLGIVTLRPELAGRVLKSPRDWLPLLIFPGLMVAFHLLEAAGRRARAGRVAPDPAAR